jgi:DNA ligase D-like protein (predicted 3'-phosphoesterase)
MIPVNLPTNNTATWAPRLVRGRKKSSLLGAGMSRYVIQKHQARTLHYDFRLERDGVFKSWAVPKGVPEEPGVRRLALQVEDHTLEFGDFEGEIPSGQYGAGTIAVWDHGNYELHEWTDDRISLTLHGTRLQGQYHMARFWRKGKREWLVWREDG